MWRTPAASHSIAPNKIRATPPHTTPHQSGPHAMIFQIGVDLWAELKREAELETWSSRPETKIYRISASQIFDIQNLHILRVTIV
jgi:hypothetical protein